MSEAFTPGELELVYELVREHPKELSISTSGSTTTVLNVKVTAANQEFAGYLDFMIRRLRLARKFLGQTINNTNTLELDKCHDP